MNNQSPLVPQGSLLEQKNQNRARVKIAVFVVLAIHSIGLLALLMQGCKKEPETVGVPEPTNNAATTFVEPTNAPPPVATTPTVVATNTSVAPVEPPPPQTQPLVPTAAATDYKVAKGDLLTSIAKKFHVSLKQLTDANPGVDPTKLQIGQTLHIPAPTTAVTGSTAGETGSAAASGGPQVYTVKSGDSLIKIAGQFGTTVKALRSANSLTTDKIVVGQKLKVPAKVSAPSAPSTTPAEIVPATTAATSAPVTAPTAR